MANSNMPDGIPSGPQGEGPDDIGVTPGAVTPNVPPLPVQGGDEIAQQLDDMEKRVLAEGSPEVKDAVEDVQQNENPGPNENVEPDEDVDPDRDEPA